ncbi:MAG: hypothetical protein JRI49_07805 [Deltaproteobacteria bacterium]|nr:hypothetical protein [Deltaproteobacteria bacterium]
MADTTKIKTDIEPYVRDWLSRQFSGHIFKERSISLSTGSSYNFDAVTEDNSIVGAILCGRPRTSGGNENTGAVRKGRNDIESLKLLPAVVKKLMVFTDSGLLELINRRAARFGTESIEMILCPLPVHFAELVKRILDNASNEQRAAH